MSIEYYSKKWKLRIKLHGGRWYTTAKNPFASTKAARDYAHSFGGGILGYSTRRMRKPKNERR